MTWQYQRYTIALLAITCLSGFASSWDADAGVRPSYTKNKGVIVTTSSNQNSAARILDSDDNTNWVSANCLPSHFVSRADLNLLLGLCQANKCSVNNGHQNLTAATDGNFYTTARVKHGSLTVTLQKPSALSIISVNGYYDHTVSLYGYTISGQKILIRDFHPSDNYKGITIMNTNHTVAKLELATTNGGFGIKEIAAMGPDGCEETVQIDLGATKRVGTIRTRHWSNNNARKLDLSVSEDGKTWTFIKNLDPTALRPITTVFGPMNARYIRLLYTLESQNYKHVYCYEIDAWDENGIWGPQLMVLPQRKTVREIMGVNGIWGWGHKAFSNTLAPGEGPTLYNKVASIARNYHNLNWDVTDPDNDPQFTKMAAGKGTQANFWLNWDTEYRAWRAANLTIDISVQFTNKSFPQNVWNTPEQSAFNYGHEFANHFGPTHGNGLVYSVEVGNEPWDYDAGFYATVLEGMTAGIRNTDSKLLILPGAFQAENKHETNTYIGTRVLPEVANDIDVINCHSYSFINTDQGKRIGTYPEHKQSTFNNIRPLSRWRDANMPNKPLWVTEWGWDGERENEDCANTECVSEKAQAVYGIRGLMILIRSGIERTMWFFYANSPDCNTLFCRSGLTTSKSQQYKKKTVFLLFEDLISRIGDKYFIDVLQEDNSGYIYMFGNDPSSRPAGSGHGIATATHIIGWLPIDINNNTVSNVDITLPTGMYPSTGWRYNGERYGLEVLPLTKLQFLGNTFRMSLSTEPSLIQLEKTSGIIG